MATTSNRISGGCSCGAVKVSVDPNVEPLSQLWCHCSDCRLYYKAPIVPLIAWAENVGDTVKILQGEDNLAKTRMSDQDTVRLFCRSCGDPVISVLNGAITCTRPVVVPDYPFKPTLHLYYKERKMQLHDGLPKFEDKPAEFGGSGKTLGETGQPSK